MKYTIKNLIGSPYNVPTAEGVVHIPAHGAVELKASAITLHNIKAMGIFEVIEAAGKSDPLDHDGDGKKGGSVPKRGRPRKDAE